MTTPLSTDVRALLEEPNFAHLATVMPEGSPQSAPVWVGVEGDHLLVATGEGSLKAKNTRRDPRVSVSIVAMDNPYRRSSEAGWSSGGPMRSSRSWTGSPASTSARNSRCVPTPSSAWSS